MNFPVPLSYQDKFRMVVKGMTLKPNGSGFEPAHSTVSYAVNEPNLYLNFHTGMVEG